MLQGELDKTQASREDVFGPIVKVPKRARSSDGDSSNVTSEDRVPEKRLNTGISTTGDGTTNGDEGKEDAPTSKEESGSEEESADEEEKVLSESLR